jgi:lipopolysaccharide transport system permease protein
LKATSTLAVVPGPVAGAADLFDHQHVTVIEPPRGWRMLDWRELWAYRELLWVLVARDVRVRYKQTVLGAGWAVIRPLTAMLIFSIVFGHLARMPSDGYPYPVFVFAGLLPWTFFSTAISAAGQSLVGSAHLVSKVYFPRLIIPLASAGAALVDLVISTAILLLMLLWYGLPVSWHLLAAPLLLAAVAVAALGMGTLLSALTVTFRDFSHITPFLVQVWMYVTPVVFPVSLVPAQWQWLLYANPMTGLTEAFRWAFLGKPMDMVGLGLSLAVGASLLLIGVAYFERAERKFADVI